MVEKKSIFEKHPFTTILVIYLIVSSLFLTADLIYSNLVLSKPTAMVHFHEMNPEIGHVNKKNFTSSYRFKDGITRLVHFNNLGFRDEINYSEKEVAESKKITVFAVGDSTTVSFEVENSYTYPSVLGERLGKNYFIVNAGTRGYDTHQVIVQYLSVIKKLKPDILIYMICENDINQNIDNYYYKDLVAYYGKGYIDHESNNELKYIKPHWNFSQSIKVFLESNLTITYSIIHAIKHKLVAKLIHDNDDSNIEQEGLELTKKLLHLFSSVTESSGTTVFVTFFPGENVFTYDRNQFLKTIEYRHYNDIKEYINEDIKNITFIPIYDYLLEKYPAPFQSSPFHFREDGHANILGDQVIGSYIAEFLLHNLAKK